MRMRHTGNDDGDEREGFWGDSRVVVFGWVGWFVLWTLDEEFAWRL